MVVHSCMRYLLRDIGFMFFARNGSPRLERPRADSEREGDERVKSWIIYNQAELTGGTLPLDAKHRIFTQRPQRQRSHY
nr:MAG TPA: hypothetical protein [Caudoviricetes sp.]